MKDDIRVFRPYSLFSLLFVLNCFKVFYTASNTITLYDDAPWIYDPFHEKTNSVDPDQPKHAAQANPDRHCSPPVDFLFQETLLYNSISLRRNVGFLI